MRNFFMRGLVIQLFSASLIGKIRFTYIWYHWLRQKCETKTMFVLRKNGLFYINFCRCIIVFRHFTSIFHEISKICKIHVLIQSCTLNTLLESKSSSLFNIKNEYFKMREVGIPQQWSFDLENVYFIWIIL